MDFLSPNQERIFISTVKPEENSAFEKGLKNGLTIIWNLFEDGQLIIDNKETIIEKNCILFLTEYHHAYQFDFRKINVIHFNRSFYCIESNDTETGCKGLLFYGASTVPKIMVPQSKNLQFRLLWEMFEMEMNERDNLKIEMLRAMLKRFLILCLRVYKDQNRSIPMDDFNIAIIREFNYQVEKNYKHFTKVSDYANLLHKSPKTISNLFNKFTNTSPLKVINERRFLEARRLLIYTDLPIQEIAYDLNFTDTQAFSNFFKKKEKLAPSQFRTKFKI